MSDAFPSLISPILDDRPATEDALDFTHYVNALIDVLVNPDTRTPLTLGVFGSWGSGKTSLMTMLKKRLDARRQHEKRQVRQDEIVRSHLSVWFDAWLYSRDEALWRTLILRVLAELRHELGGDPKARQALDKIEADLTPTAEPASLGELVISGRALVSGSGEAAEFRLPLVTGLEFLQKLAEVRGKPTNAEDASRAAVTAFVQTVRQMHTALSRERVETLETFHRDFQELVRKYVRPGFLVVFVDDLDRCLPEKTLQVLEAIKLFLDVPGCIFVLGLDPEAVQDAVQTRYRNETKARQYLEKIIQLSFLLPPIEAENMRDFVESLVPYLPDPRCSEVFAEGLPRNPRQVKHTINIFLLLWELSRRKLPESIQPVRLAKVVAIQQSYPDLYALLREMPRLLRDLEAYFRAEADFEEVAAPDASGVRPEMSILPPQLQPFLGRATLRSLLTLHPADMPDVNFVHLTPQDIQPYIYLTRRVEARPEIPTKVPQPEMVRIPAGEFTMGGEAYDNEKPVHQVFLPEFQIGRYPVTNYEYRAFVQDTDANPPLRWEGNDYPETLGDHPVVYATWYDALAYCQWLSEKTGKPYRLPSEAEWEKTARGVEAQEWPWGNGWNASNCNSKESGLGHTTPVGRYSPHGDSPFGMADMAGNVKEWCSSQLKSYPYRVDDGREDLTARNERVLRGGAFADEQRFVRCAFRQGRLPSSRDRDIGFRVALSFP